MKTIMIMLLALFCASCIGTKVARPLKSVDVATEWLGTGGCQTYYLKLITNGTGTLVYILPLERLSAREVGGI